MSKYAEIQAKISELQKQADQVYASEKKAAVTQVKDLIKLYGLSAAEVGLVKSKAIKTTPKPARKTAATKGKRAAAKKAAFVGPNGETWGGGRGKRPAWVNEILASGGDIEQYRVK
jgi:DNA-binding protein H-NS